MCGIKTNLNIMLIEKLVVNPEKRTVHPFFKRCVSIKVTVYWPAIKQGKLACTSAGHPSGWLGKRFSPLTASRPKTKEKGAQI